MIFKLQFTLSEAYYKEAYDAFVSLSKYRKWQTGIGLICICVGLLFYWLDSTEGLSVYPFIIMGCGVFELFQTLWLRSKWVKQRMKEQPKVLPIEIEISDTGIKQSSSSLKGDVTWQDIKSIRKTYKGIVLKYENTTGIYLPDRVFSTQAEIDFILSKQKFKL